MVSLPAILNLHAGLELVYILLTGSLDNDHSVMQSDT